MTEATGNNRERFSFEETDRLVHKVKAPKQIICGSSSHLSTLGHYKLQDLWPCDHAYALNSVLSKEQNTVPDFRCGFCW